MTARIIITSHFYNCEVEIGNLSAYLRADFLNERRASEAGPANDSPMQIRLFSPGVTSLN